MSLRTLLTGITLAFMVLTLIASVSLVLLTSALDEAAERLANAIEAVWRAEEIEVALLLHDRSRDPLLRIEKEAELRQRLEETRRYVSSEERALLSRARERVEAYLLESHEREAASPQPAGSNPLLKPAFEAVETLVRTKIQAARETQSQANRWNRLGDLVGGATVTALLLGTGGLLFWLNASAFRPVFKIEQAMQEFGRGDKSSRAPEKGPRELRQIAASFNGMASALERQQQNQMAFLAGVAHDLRNPLSALLMSTAVVTPDGPLPSEDRIRSILSVTQRQVQRLNRMVGDFLDAAQIEAGRLQLVFEHRDARELAREVFELFQTSSESHEIRLQLPDHEMPLRCDSMRVEQVLNNLVSNAIKYSPRGGPITLAVEAKGHEVAFTVTDKGIGMAPEECAQIFEPFRRVGSSRDAIPGAGLGLFVARRIVEAHGGRITVESTAGEGSRFQVLLPA